MQLNIKDEEVRCFQSQGFLRLGNITSVQELAWLTETYDAIVKAKIGSSPALATTIFGQTTLPPLITVVSPEGIVPALKTSQLLRNARRAVTRLLEVEEGDLRSGWRLFCKPAQGEETPWHQDAAYRPPPHHGASVWMSLDPATTESSCLSYVGGSHVEGVRPHHFHDDHLVADCIDSSQAVLCPVEAGEALVHHCCTLHCAGPNITNMPRRAIVVVFQVEKNI